MKRWAAIAVLAAAPAFGHRLDEYLQATLVSVEKDRVQGEITLTPGVAVYRVVLAAIDKNSDGVISEAEQQAYAAQVLTDLTLTMDGHPLTPRLLSRQFPSIESIKEGSGEIRIVFSAALPWGGRNRTLTFDNHHQSRIAAYMVNALVPSDPGIRIAAQKRNFTQSYYQLEYSRAGLWSDQRLWLASIALVLFARFAWLWRKRPVLSEPRPAGASMGQ